MQGRDLPDNATVGCENAFGEWSAIMSAESTGSMNAIAKPGQQDFAVAESDFFPAEHEYE